MARKVRCTAFVVLLWMQMLYSCKCYLRIGDPGVCLQPLNPTLDWRSYNYPSITVEKDKLGTHVTATVCCYRYEYNQEKDGCVPICTSCINGTCIDPDTCVCESPQTLVDGYCVAPTCTNCEHGDCIAPDVCECHPGYVKSEGTCKKFCDKACISGHCVGTNKCKCHDGYMLDPNDPFKCIPCDGSHELKCTVTCRNGYCSPPTKCTCVPRKKSSIFQV